MTPDEILAELSKPFGFPRAALEAARGMQDALVPQLVEMLERMSDENRSEEGPIFYGVHLLGEWRATAAYRPICRILGGDADLLDLYLGEAITETIPSIVFAVFDGDAQPMLDVIANENADEFARDALIEVLVALVLDGRLDRAWMKDWLVAADRDLRPRSECQVWYGWQEAIAALGFDDLAPIVRLAFEDGRIASFMGSFRHFQSDLADTLSGGGTAARKIAQRCAPFDNTVALIENWEFARVAEGRATPPRLPPPRAKPNPAKAGRNDPCPCGSGLKFKKCCLGKATALIEAGR